MGSRLITADDVVRAGACPDGVGVFIRRCKGIAAAVTAAVALRFAKTHEEREWIRKAADLDGYGSGYGSGDGSGDGSGAGSGYGDGYGYGDGDGYGDGYGYGESGGDGYSYGSP